MALSELITFLTKTMSMTDVYQPVIIKELLLNDGECTKDQLAKTLAGYDPAIHDYYRRVVMRYPKTTLAKHGIIRYERQSGKFCLNFKISDDRQIRDAILVCDDKIQKWMLGRRDPDKSALADAPVRYRVLKASNKKCALCGIPSSLRPIDIDHIEPKSTADKYGKVVVNGRQVHVDSEENLQALCFKCNRAKRDQDNTDFRRTKKLVRDRIPEIIRAHGQEPKVRELTDKALITALDEKLVEEHEEYIENRSIEELVDMIEVILTLAKKKGSSTKQLLKAVEDKRSERGGFERGYFYEGDRK